MEYPIRVAQIIGEAPNGGVESIIKNLYLNINREYFQFDFYVNNTSEIINKEEIERLGGRVIIIPPYKKNLIVFESFLQEAFLKEKYAIVHSNMNTLSFFVLRAAKKAGVPFRIAHSHSTSNKKEGLRNFVKNALRFYSKKYANVFFSCSEMAGKWLFGVKAFNSGKVTVIDNGIDIEKFKYNATTRERIRTQYHIAKNTILIGNVGRLVSQKNQSFLLDIFKEVLSDKNACLMIVGDGPLKNKLIEKVAQLGIQNKVIFTGTQKYPEQYYSAMDCFVLPSLYEGLPIVGVEAQVNGLPCVFSDQITQEAKITPNCHFESLEASSDEWKKEIISNISTRREETWKVFAGGKFDIKASAKKLEEKYFNLIKNSEVTE